MGRSSARGLILAVILASAAAISAGWAAAGEKAPQFTLEKPFGGVITSADIAGKLTIITFWATWCAPCVQEMPHLENAYKKYAPGGLMVIGVNFGQEREQVIRFLSKRPVAYPMALDGEKTLSKHYQVGALPFSILIGQDGNALFKHVGILTETQIETWVHDAGRK